MSEATATAVIPTYQKHHKGMDEFDLEAERCGRAEYRLSELRPNKRPTRKNSRGRVTIAR